MLTPEEKAWRLPHDLPKVKDVVHAHLTLSSRCRVQIKIRAPSADLGGACKPITVFCNALFHDVLHFPSSADPKTKGIGLIVTF